MITYLLAWIPMIFIAILNGFFREAVIKKWVAESAAHQLSTATLLLLLGFYIYYFIRRFPPASIFQAMVIGLMWMLLTLGFEFGLGLSRGMTWSAMLADYNLLQGRIWVFVPVWMLLAPTLFFLAGKTFTP